MVFHDLGRFRKVGVVSGSSKSIRREAEVVSSRVQVVSSRLEVVSSNARAFEGRPGRALRRVKMVSGRVEGVLVRVKIASGRPKSCPDGKLQNHWFSYGFPMVFHGFGRIRVVSERSKSYPKAISVKGGASKSHPEGQSASGEPFRRVKIASGSSKSCPGGSFGGSKWYPGGSKAFP